MSKRGLFVAGAGTEIGKTYVTAALTRRLRSEGRAVLALKPVASGVPPLGDPAFAGSDTAILLAALGLPTTPATVAACTPWRFAAALGPDLAAAREGRGLDPQAVIDWCRRRIGEAPEDAAVLVEGVGGLMSPLSADATGLDWLVALGLPALLVSGSYLGAISHALTAAEVLAGRGVRLGAVVVSESLEAPVAPETVAEALARRIAAPAIVLRRGAPCPDTLLDALAPLLGLHTRL
ncbi:dethiobiotin synthase [Methylobacterium sp. sgz302541]|uniref:dethiobiotin synthase n=1 Tax=unclassified Methylobacterium TaxID=2615210 RepID=UPI003D339457